MAIEFIPKKEKEGSYENLIFIVSFVVLLIFFFLSGFVYFTNQEKELTKIDLEAQLNQLQTQELQDLEGEILFKKVQIEKAQELLNEHIYSAYIFDFLGENLLNDITLTKLDADLSKDGLTIQIEGVTKEFKNISLQENHFKSNEEVKNFVVTAINKNEKSGELVFSSTLTFQDNFLNYKTE